MNIETHEQYYRVNHTDGFVEIVRRYSKFTSGYMSPAQLGRIIAIELELATINMVVTELNL